MSLVVHTRGSKRGPSMHRRLRRGGFSPGRESAVELWLPADQFSLTADATAVATYQDASGNAANMAQATPGDQPTVAANSQNGRPGVNFDGTEYMQSANAGLIATFTGDDPSMTVAVCCKPASASQNGVILSTGRAASNDGETNFRILSTGAYSYFRQADAGASGGAASATSLVTTNAQIIVWRVSTTTVDCWVDNSQVITSASVDVGSHTPDAVRLCARSEGAVEAVNFQGVIYDMAVFSSAISTALRNKIQGDWASKYNITLS